VRIANTILPRYGAHLCAACSKAVHK